MGGVMEAKTNRRIESIDLIRGVVMILMALDHARMYFAQGFFYSKPTDLATTTPFLFFTRWITHFCAPVFVFLAGTSAFLYGTRRNSIKEVSWFLFTRGIWLVFIEVVIIRFGWTFDITFSAIILQVIWIIGISMIILSVLVFLPRWLVLATGLVMVFGHNIFDSIGVHYFDSVGAGAITAGSLVSDMLHQPNFVVFSPDFVINFVYPLIPWPGLMALGYIFGELYRKDFDPAKRKRWLLWMGIGAVVLFFILRAFNLYGDPKPWEVQSSIAFSVISFFNVTKYPVSLSFLLITLGPAFIFLYLVENIKNRATDFLIIFGRVPFFFYVIHIYLIHLLAFIGIAYAGRAAGELILTTRALMSMSLADYGYSLWVTYVVWILVVLLLYPLCKRYNDYKANNRAKWWLSYL
jgi:uncharacterized membrane protein